LGDGARGFYVAGRGAGYLESGEGVEVMKSPMTDKTLGIHVDHEQTFADLRKKAADEYIERAKKRKRDKTIPLPKFKIGDFIVVSHGYTNKSYSLIEIIDIEFIGYRKDYDFFGIIYKTTERNLQNRIGRLYKSDRYLFNGMVENLPAESIKWIYPPHDKGIT
jgi:hypothetical protein